MWSCLFRKKTWNSWRRSSDLPWRSPPPGSALPPRGEAWHPTTCLVAVRLVGIWWRGSTWGCARQRVLGRVPRPPSLPFSLRGRGGRGSFAVPGRWTAAVGAEHVARYGDELGALGAVGAGGSHLGKVILACTLDHTFQKCSPRHGCLSYCATGSGCAPGSSSTRRARTAPWRFFPKPGASLGSVSQSSLRWKLVSSQS